MPHSYVTCLIHTWHASFITDEQKERRNKMRRLNRARKREVAQALRDMPHSYVTCDTDMWHTSCIRDTTHWSVTWLAPPSQRSTHEHHPTRSSAAAAHRCRQGAERAPFPGICTRLPKQTRMSHVTLHIWMSHVIHVHEVCMCMIYIYICTYIYVCVCIYIYTHIYIYIYAWTCREYTYTWKYI